MVIFLLANCIFWGYIWMKNVASLCSVFPLWGSQSLMLTIRVQGNIILRSHYRTVDLIFHVLTVFRNCRQKSQIRDKMLFAWRSYVCMLFVRRDQGAHWWLRCLKDMKKAKYMIGLQNHKTANKSRYRPAKKCEAEINTGKHRETKCNATKPATWLTVNLDNSFPVDICFGSETNFTSHACLW